MSIIFRSCFSEMLVHMNYDHDLFGFRVQHDKGVEGMRSPGRGSNGKIRSKSPSCLVTSGSNASLVAEEIVAAEIASVQHPTDALATPENVVRSLDSANENLLNKVSLSTGPWAEELLTKADKLRITEDDPGLPRGCRQKVQNKGYKGKIFQDKLCLACDSAPPTISPFVARNLGSTFCDIEVDKLTNDILHKKKKAPAPVGKRLAAKKKQHDPDHGDKDKTPRKKSKKVVFRL